MTAIKHFCNKIWNLFRFSNDRFEALNHIPQISGDFISPTKALSSSSFNILDDLLLVDKYILSKLSDTVMRCQKAFESLELYKATEAIRIFITEELCGVYLEFIKPILYKDTEKEVYTTIFLNDFFKDVHNYSMLPVLLIIRFLTQSQRTTLKVLEICLDSSLRLLHPFMPFITEVIYHFY